MDFRIGQGYDIHRLVPSDKDHKFVLGGIEIPFDKGFVAHSDGDVLVHAIIDALLGALALGDIGTFFPDNDVMYKNADSMKLLEEVDKMVKAKGYAINNIDATVICEKPKLRGHIFRIKQNIAQRLSLVLDKVSVKAKTNEKMDSVGEGLAVSVHAVVLLLK